MNAAADYGRRLLTRPEAIARMDRMPIDTQGGDPRLIESLEALAQAYPPPPYFDPLPETPLRRKARELAERAVVAMRFSAPANDVIACLVRAADLYEAADDTEVEP